MLAGQAGMLAVGAGLDFVYSHSHVVFGARQQHVAMGFEKLAQKRLKKETAGLQVGLSFLAGLEATPCFVAALPEDATEILLLGHCGARR